MSPIMLPISLDFWHTALNRDRDGFHLETILFVGDGEAYDAGLAVKGLGGVEDEIADAGVDLMTMIVFDGLQGVGVMADEDNGAGADEHVGIMPLTRHGLQRVLASPMEGDDDDGGGVGLSESEDA